MLPKIQRLCCEHGRQACMVQELHVDLSIPVQDDPISKPEPVEERHASL